ncbi:MAG TPA: L-aspartate oxidase [Mycobacterium sp.]|nr:L-aspartate oxidase [Mycobacterium sp.]
MRIVWRQRADVVVVGTGVGGLSAAQAVRRAGRSVIVLNKDTREIGVTATHYAQGGIAVVLPDTDDSVSDHVADTVAAGGGLCDPEAVESIVADGYRAVTELAGHGARFDRAATGEWALTREGGHSRRRIIHAGGDATGAEVQRALDLAAAALDIRRGHVACQILCDGGAVSGVLVANSDGIGIIDTPSVILATGGLGHLYRATTNPDGATGDGVALALGAGAAVSDLEFIQFHPTMLYSAHAGGRRPLISEAVRGEGASLIDDQGRPVTAGVHPMGDLAPRDVVAAAIDTRLKETGAHCVYLDGRTILDFANRFPTITASCRAAGIDPQTQPIPVVPGAHYSCGGVVTDVCGRTDLPGLFAAGEVGRTGMHGANRLASNSLLEGVVVGGRAGTAAAAHSVSAGPVGAAMPEVADRPALDRAALQQAMSRDASVVRDADGLRRLAGLLSSATPRPIGRLIDFEDTALTLTARVVAAAAAARTESRGCHHRAEFRGADPAQARSTVVRLTDDALAVEAPAAVG